MADTSILGDDVVLTLNLQDDGTIKIKQSDLATLLPKVDASTGNWLVSGVDSGVKAKADTVTISSSTSNWVIFKGQRVIRVMPALVLRSTR